MTETISSYQVQISLTERSTRQSFHANNTIEVVTALQALFNQPDITAKDVEAEDAELGLWLIPLPVETVRELEEFGYIEAEALGRVFDTDVVFHLSAEWPL